MFCSDLAFVRSDLVVLLVFFIVFSDCARSGKGNRSEKALESVFTGTREVCR